MIGVIMAGGKSSRMLGYDKAFIQYHQKPQWEYCYELLKPYGEVIVNSQHEYFPIPIISDLDCFADGGPMTGLLSVWTHKQDIILALGIDYPMIKSQHIQELVQEHERTGKSVIAFAEEFFHPTIGIYTRQDMRKIEDAYQSGIRSLQKVLHTLDIEKMEWDASILHSINTRDDHDMQKNVAVQKVNILKHSDSVEQKEDCLSIEEPLEIYMITPNWQKVIAVTMRTPGTDDALAIGFLYNESIIEARHLSEISIQYKGENKIAILISSEISIDRNLIDRNFYTTSSCGVCGKASIESAMNCHLPVLYPRKNISINASLIKQLPEKLRAVQSSFLQTGGIHAAALFTFDGELITFYEDVGRHNALDKLVGHFYLKNELPLDQYILLLSGRASFELMQKAARAGIRIVCAIGAPSSLAVKFAEEADITLVGFVKAISMNIYCGEERISME